MTRHSWAVSCEEARQIQNRLRHEVRFPLKKAEFRWVGGADVAYDRATEQVVAAIVVLDAESGRVAAEAHAVFPAEFPYIPGLLSFREAPSVLAAWDKLATKPEVLVLDGQGTAHPRRFGLACHLGLWLNVPSLGCAKSRLLGEFEEPGVQKGSFSDLIDHDEVVGAVVRTRSGVRPVFVSPGYLLPRHLCIQVVLSWSKRWRIPEPTRQAHLLVTRLRRELVSDSASHYATPGQGAPSPLPLENRGVAYRAPRRATPNIRTAIVR